ncbi:hypothetical protein EDD85DRAFT_364516 [Armillaria nabsnona]|nr:hypothetical protein EDD85DRAFT_364516 [Armillaria nabsnona]
MTGHQIQAWPQGDVQASSDVRPTQYNSLQQPLHHHSTQPMGHEYVGHYNSHSQESWLSEQSNFRGRAVYGDPFPPRVEPALSLSHQSWNETSARTQIVPSDPSEAVSLETAVSARPVHGAPDLTSGYLENVVRYDSCPSGYVVEKFDNHAKNQLERETIRKFTQIFGAAYKDPFFYRQDVNEVVCNCPIADCKGPMFKGGDIKFHIETYHSEIISSKGKVVCGRKSNKESRCPMNNEVQGRHFLTHFRELHLNAHGKCPFCDTQVTRVPAYFKTHFATCKRLTTKHL